MDVMYKKKTFSGRRYKEIETLVRDYYEKFNGSLVNFHLTEAGDVRFITNWVGSSLIKDLYSMDAVVIVESLIDGYILVSVIDTSDL